MTHQHGQTHLDSKGIRHGFIVADETARHELESMGIVLGEYKDGTFTDCVVPETAYDLLDPEWGQYYWKLEEIRYLH